MIKLWGRLNSINVQKVVWALEEVGVPYHRIEAGGPFGVVDEPAYRAKNPNGLIPTLEDEDFILWESNAIVRYLAGKYSVGTLCPADLRQRADADRWMDWQVCELGPSMRDAFIGLIRMSPEKRQQAMIDASVEATARRMKILEAALAHRPYLAGDSFTMGDIPAGCAAHRWLNLPIERAPLPHVETWYARLMERAPARAVLVTPIT